MTIDEAIKILHQDLGADTYDKHPGLYQAQKLALAALARCQVLAENNPLWAARPLPSETKE
jgi:hypothetical protein